MTNIILTRLEKILLALAAFALLASILLALCISLVLPYHWTTEDYVPRSANNPEELSVRCKCNQQRFATSYFNCMPRVFSERSAISNSTERTCTICETIQNYSYAVSLNAPAYSDDKNERRYACSGIILSTAWVLVGQDCVHHNDELKELKIRVGSNYWFKGGTEYSVSAIVKFVENGSFALKVDKPLTFDTSNSAVKILNQKDYVTWSSAVSINWSKGKKKKYGKLIVQRWTTTSCQKVGSVGEVRTDPVSVCNNHKFGKTLVTETGVLVAVQSEICHDKNTTKYVFRNVQTEEYRKWLKSLVENLDDKTESITKSIPKSLKIYECLDLDYTKGTSEANEETTEAEITTTDYQTETKSDSSSAPSQPTHSVSSTEGTSKIITSLITESTMVLTTQKATLSSKQISGVVIPSLKVIEKNSLSIKKPNSYIESHPINNRKNLDTWKQKSQEMNPSSSESYEAALANNTPLFDKPFNFKVVTSKSNEYREDE